MYLLDRLLFYVAAFILAIAMTLPFLKGWKKHRRFQGMLIVFLTLIMTQFGPTVLFEASIPGRENAGFDGFEVVDTFSFRGSIYVVSTLEYPSLDDETDSFTSSKLAVYVPWLFGYYESTQDPDIFSLLYDDHQGERALILFHLFELDDGSVVVVIGNTCQDPLTSLVIEGQSIDLTPLNDPDFVYFVVSPDDVIYFLTDSIVYNGVEIGRAND